MLSDTERDTIHDILVRERDRVTSSMNRTEEQAQATPNDTGELSLYNQHPADLGTETYVQEQNLLLAQQLSRRQEQIDDALRRLQEEPEKFGSCERCGQPIGMERLEVIPEGRFCAACQELIETQTGVAGA